MQSLSRHMLTLKGLGLGSALRLTVKTLSMTLQYLASVPDSYGQLMRSLRRQQVAGRLR